MDNFLWLNQIQPRDRLQVGEKAFHLSHLAQRGYPVIPGFAIEASVLRDFLEKIDWFDPLFADLPNSSLHLDVDNPRQLQLVARAIRQEITTATLPTEWKTALASFSAGIEASALILRPSLALPSETGVTSDLKISGLLEAHVCDRNEEALAAAIKRVWAELFRARSLLYWRRNGIQIQHINLAILVQPLYNSLAAGLVQASPNLWEIQATCGLGMALIKGEVLPDYYQVQPESGTVLMQQLGVKTLAYNLKELPSWQGIESKNGLSSPLQTYSLGEEQQQLYALEEKYLKQLIRLAQQLTDEIGPAFTVEWTLTAKGSESSAAELYITQVRSAQEMGSMESTSLAFDSGEQGRQADNETSRQAVEESILTQHSFLTTHSSPNAQSISSSQEPSVAHPLRGIGAAGGRAIAPAQAIASFSHNPEITSTGRVLVVKTFHPDWLPLLKHAAGVVAEQGGMTCHAAIIARELGIPAVVGVRDATQSIQSDEFVLVDGDRGEIYLLGKERTAFPSIIREKGEWSMEPSVSGTGHTEVGKPFIYNPQHPISRVLHNTPELPDAQLPIANTQGLMPNIQLPITATTSPIVATQLLVNLSQPSTIERAASLPVDGVGLLRSELMMLEVLQGQHPGRWLTSGRKQELVELMAQTICQFAAAFAPRPVFYRSLDWRSHEFQSLAPSFPSEVNPMLGMRGTFSYLQDPSLFDVELSALVKVYQSGYTNVNLLLPFVRTVEEFSFCRSRVEQAGLLHQSHFQLWIMAEVPSILFLLPDYIKAGCMGISIGTNDLTQLLLGVDRDRAEMAIGFDERHPAVMEAIAQLIRTAKQEGIPCSICGQAPAKYPELIDRLVEWGISSISVSLDAVERTYTCIARAEQRLLLEAARSQKSKVKSQKKGRRD
ncbi:phosphoenolpyruvate synthase [Planktothrix sp. FACHB-1355]|uniref:Phosphoenolpyruvate synthase n=1 Tax=Aerosakkonema funiforme FACHB-1375 TaxID=2949571 RepID=A0A926ZJW2_9CYAN|nr:putative PEP-binding protein [Aerosakkonema funiforme]MBD2185094.1 phosphoenolpyruvate synthase [Aerosakkonema funiforme FACHB-1375]MBD3560003.1 phosphoenolpyruvate synthase [Planktothrix sp. FACHB-1355]